MARDSDTRLVYSSETGRVQRDAKQSAPSTQPALKPADGILRLRREVKGRGGGTVIVINGFTLAEKELKDLAGVLKKKCGCGGTVKQGVIEIQGDHRETLLQELQSRGFRVKLAGG